MKKIDNLIKEILITTFNIKNKKKLKNKEKLSDIPNFDSVGWAILLTEVESKLKCEFDLNEFNGNETLDEFINKIKKQI